MKQFNLTELDNLFHAYDIRGLVAEGLNGDFYYQLGKAFVTFLDAKKIAVGHDIRSESSEFAEMLIAGVLESGCDVVEIDEIATEMLYFTVGEDKSLDGGIAVTASHNPVGWNGAKLVREEAKAISGDSGLQEIKEILLQQNFRAASDTPGQLLKHDPYPAFKQKIHSFFGDTQIKPLKVVVDAGNGVGGVVFNKVFGDLPLDVTEMFFEPDGTFPNHTPNPIKEENVQDIKAEIKANHYDLGIAIDGDADRVFFIDDTGRNPMGVYTGSLIARNFAKIEQNPKILHDPRVVWPITKESDDYIFKSVISKSGHSFIKERMAKEDAIFGLELSSHFYYRDFYYADSGFVTIAIMLKMISEGLDFTKEMDYFYSTYPVSGEVNFVVDDATASMEKITAEFSEQEIDRTDGISIDMDEWRFNLRKSNTEPVIRLNVEAVSESALKLGFETVKNLIQGEMKNQPGHEALK